jgi:predicted amidophosphoribosyltransferase
MRKNTPKRAAINRKSDVMRKAFIELNPRCWLCETPQTQCHEICQGCNRHEAILHPQNYLAFCPDCHAHVHKATGVWTAERQIALKFLNSSYTLESILECVNSMRVKQAWAEDVKRHLRMK